MNSHHSCLHPGVVTSLRTAESPCHSIHNTWWRWHSNWWRHQAACSSRWCHINA